MTSDGASEATVPSTSLATILLDGLFTGMIGAIAVAIWFLILDTLAGHPLRTPALLGSVLLHGGKPTLDQAIVAPLEVAAYTAFHFVAFIAVGILFSYLMSLFDRFPIMFFVLLVSFLSLMVGFFFLDAALGAHLVGQLQTWSVVVANLLAAAGMALYQWRRHPGALKGIERLWRDDN